MKKGGKPVIISNIRLPRAHQSTEGLMLTPFWNISGGRYSGVPAMGSVLSS